MTRRQGGGVKRREANLARDQFPKCSSQPRTPKEIHRVKQRREGGGRRQKRPGGKKAESKGKRAIRPVTTLLSKNGC